MEIQPGQRIAVKIGDELIEDTVHSVRHLSARPEILKHPTGWRKLLRHMTPRRWRKSLPVARPYQPASTEVIMPSEHVRRAQRTVADVNRKLGDLLR